MHSLGTPSSSTLSEPRRFGQRAVVDDGDAVGGDLVADAAGECRRALAIEVAFETVTDCFVQQHAGPARTEHDGHAAGRRRHRFEIDQRLAHRFARQRLRAAVGQQFAIAVTAAAAGRCPARAGRSVRRSPAR